MNYRTDDDLDRALFALPLEQPPTGLRTAILTATAYAPPPPFSVVDVLGIGLIAAIGIWLVVGIVLGGSDLLGRALATIASFFRAGASDYDIWAWLAAGGATAIWLSLFTGFQPLALRARRSERQSAR